MDARVTWEARAFDQLTPRELYAVLAARQDVFILEQQCFYNDFDGHDQAAHHLLGWVEVDGRRELAACLRVLAPGAKYAEASIGRVLSTRAFRRTGIGRELVAQGIALVAHLHPGHAIRIGAQAYLEDFYASFGFERVSETYLEDDIPHVDMLRAA